MHNIQFTTSTLIKWLNGCHTAEQLHHFASTIVPTFLTARYQGIVEDYILRLTLQNLEKQVKLKQLMLSDPEALAQCREEESQRRVYSSFITPQGNLITRLNSVSICS